MTNSVIIKGLRIYAYHGVMPQERKIGAYFTIDLKIDTDFSQAMETDQLEGTISYADVYEIVKGEMAIPSQLLEHAAGRIVKALHEHNNNVNRISLRIMKENPPMGADIQGAGVEIVE